MPSMDKPKRRNSEKRKEKSRDAARNRRGKELEVFTDLISQLPLPNGDASQLDKASVLRLAISVLKLRRMLGDEDRGLNLSNGFNRKLDQQYLKALEGFLMVISSDGDITYLSENVSKYLGLAQVDLVGQNVFDYTHPCDHDEIREMVSAKHAPQPHEPTERTFFTRLKCTLTTKGRNVNLKSAAYKVLRCTGHIVHQEVKPNLGDSDTANSFLVMIAEPIPHPSNIEVPLGPCTFLSKHSLDMKFLYCDDRVYDLIGYSSSDLVGQSAYGYHHALDSTEVEKACKTLFSKGQSQIGQYRFLAKHGGYVWVITQATIIHHSKTQKPQCVVCVNFVISGVMEDGKVMSNIQQSRSPSSLPVRPPGIFREWNVDTKSDYGFTNGLTKIEELDPDEQSLYAPHSGEFLIPLDFSSFAQAGEPHDVLDDLLDTKTDTTYKNEPALYSCGNAKESVCASPEFTCPSFYMQPVDDVPPSHDAVSQQFTTDIFVDKDFELDSMDWDLRAPYIPMSCEEEIGIFQAGENLFTNACDFGESTKILGVTDTVFSSLPPSPPAKPPATTTCQAPTSLSYSILPTSSALSPSVASMMSCVSMAEPDSTVRGSPRGSPGMVSPGQQLLQKRKHGPEDPGDTRWKQPKYFDSSFSPPAMPPLTTIRKPSMANKNSVLMNLLLKNDDSIYGNRGKQIDKVTSALLPSRPGIARPSGQKWSILSPLQNREHGGGKMSDFVDLTRI
uniref:Hypoxia-inducible factor 1 n=1 Tax=Phoronopsis harmeri TaxID=490051 RepID=A0AA96HCJ6_9BILA|nr:hypoxia-inducible factor 1 [Phoronopsis harmeri]